MKRCFALLLAAGCGSVPASQIVRVEIEEPEVVAVHLLVQREDQILPVVDCTLSDGKLEGSCPFEAPSQTWAPGQPLAFVVYGDESTAIAIGAEGLDLRGEVVTATTTRRTLGEADGPPMVLIARTVARRTCFADVLQDVPVAESQRDRAFVIPADLDDDGGLELVVGTPRRISVFRWAPSGGSGCDLIETATVATDCTPRGGSMVIGELDRNHPGPELGGVCLSRSATNVNRFAVWGLEAAQPSRRLAELPITAAIGQVTRPVLADLDGDGLGELTYLVVTSTAGPLTHLARWRPGMMTPRLTVMTGLRLSSPTSSLPFAPVILGREAFVGGYRGGLFRVTDQGLTVIEATNATPPTAFAGAIVARGLDPPRALFVRDAADGTTILETKLSTGATAAVRLLAERQRIPGVAAIAVAVGDVEGRGAASAVLAADGFIQILPLTSTTAPARRFPLGDTIDGAMVVLLADIDGRPGAEIITFQPKVGRVHALDGQGRRVRGFPIEIGVPGPETRLVVTDLDGDGAMELVSLSYDRLSVVSLGPHTFHPAAAPWPQAYRDAAGRAASTVEDAVEPP